MDRIGVRELRQHASKYLARVATGESLEITDRGRPVAMLVPIPTDSWQQLIDSGQVVPPTEEGDIVDLAPLELDFDPSAVLAEMRRDER